METFFSGLARFYPCLWCAADFAENLKAKPVRAETREDLCIWLCEQHNQVNAKLGKPLFPCTLKTLDERWRKSTNPACQSDH
jgi:mitochondrial FAD-linked sulfhydryl oxidase